MIRKASLHARIDLARSIRLALLAATGAAAPLAALAQDPVAAPAASLEEIIVTGSRIRGTRPVGSPITEVSRENIELEAPLSTSALIQKLPQVFNLGVSENSRGQSGGSGNITYGSAINLRGIGPFSTLTLLDGHRAVPQGTTGFAVDPSVIPTLALERVEVVADGASALYGSDAIAGVVNLIPRREFEGVEVSVRGAQGDEYDERQVGAIGGLNWESGRGMLAYEHSYHSNLNGIDRDYFRGDLTSRGGRDFRVAQCNPGNIVVAGVSHAIPATGITPATAGQLVPGTTNRCDNAQYQDLLPEQERDSVMATFNQELEDGSIELFGDAFWTRRTFHNQVGDQAAALTVRSVNPYFVRPPGTTVTTETVNYSFGNQLPSNDTRGFSEAYQATLGARFLVVGSWELEALYSYGHDEERSTSQYGIDNAALNAALARTNPATALNPFSTQPNNEAALANLATQIFIAPGDTHFRGWELKLDGALGKLPGGDVRAAFGYEGQVLSSESGLITGTWAAPIPAIPPRVYRDIESLYAEILIPFFSTENGRAGLRELTLDLAVRQDKYSDLDDGTTVNPKYGINWAPIDSLKFRATYGESFRAPTFAQIYGNSSSLFVQNYSDPTRGGAITQGITLSGGNLELEPETAASYTLGFDFIPTPESRISLTYFHIDYEKQITSYLSDLTILNRESQFAGTGIIVRNPDPAFVAALVATKPIRGVLPNPVTLYVDGRTNNLGTTIAAGFDLAAEYNLDAGSAGEFSFGLMTTYFTTYDVAITPAADRIDQLNTIYNPLEFKARADVTWRRGGFTSALFVTHLGAYDNNLASPLQTVDSKTTFDLNLRYEFPGDGFTDGLSVALDAVNLLDEDPPFVNIAQSPNGGGGFDPTLNNPVGRIIGLTLRKKW
ncbi:MAG TPA: TonB-dependent receptor [Steroidobacteraceae bacterium]|nr:TonB-dependent receptor [Steroidobacteraceae bacterium]